MSVDRFLVLLTKEQYDQACKDAGYGETWFHALPANHVCIDFGDYRDRMPDGSLLDYKTKALHSYNALMYLKEIEEFYQICSDNNNDEFQKIELAVDKNPQLRMYFYNG